MNWIKIKKYFLRTWDETNPNIHPVLRIIPVFLFELIVILMIIAFVVSMVLKFFGVI
jgi:hypothetical protein